jgi:hypothetical protein
MADKDFVVKNGLVVNTSLILANTTSTRVGIANATPDATLTVGGTANVQGNAVVSGTTRLNGNLTIATSAGIIANGSIGTSGQALISNGTTVYWSNPIATPNTTGGTGSVQYYNGSILGSSNGITFSESTNTLSVSNTISIGAATINSTVYTGAANNASYLNGVSYTNYITTTGPYTRTGVTTFNANVVIGTTAGISGNGSYGTTGQFLTSNGTTVYWAVPTANVADQYAWTNTQTFSNTITFSGSLNVTGTITSSNTISANGVVGTAGYVLTSGGAGANAYWAVSSSANSSGGAGAVQYYNGTTFGSSLGMSFSASSNNFTVSNNITASNTVVAGGLVTTGTYGSASANGISISNTTVSIGNSTVNATINSTAYTGTAYTANNATNLGGTAASGYQTTAGLSANIASYLPTYTGIVNAASHTTGAYGGLTTNGAVVNTTTIAVGNSSVNASMNSTIYTGTANNASYLGGTLASGYQTTAGLSGNVATLAANAATYLNGKTESNLNVNNSVTSNTATYIIANTGLVSNSQGVFVNSSYIGTLSANNASYLGGTAAASYALLAGPTFTGTVTTGNTLTIGTSTYFATNGNIGIGNSSPTTKMLITGGYALTPVALGSNNSFSINCVSGNYFTLTANGSATSIAFSSAPASAMYSMVIKIANGGSNTLTWTNSPKWPSATAPTASTNTDIWVFMTDDGGTTWRGNLSQKDSR